jgi:hypothetical protein
MTPRNVILALSVCLLAGCGQEPRFPTNSPSKAAQYSLGGQTSEPTPRVSRGVTFEMSPVTRSRITLIVSASVAAFLLVFVIAFFSAREAAVPAGTAAALIGPVVAVAMSVRQLPMMLMLTRQPETALASLALDLWNLDQPLLYALYAAAGCLVLVAIASIFTRTGSVVLPIITLVAASAGVALYANVSRMLIAIADPNGTPLGGSIAEIATTISRRIVIAYAVSLGTTLLIALTVVMAFVRRRPMRGAIVIAVIALVLAGSATYVEHTWCMSLEHTVRTGSR